MSKQMTNSEYNPAEPRSIEKYSQKLLGMTFRDVYNKDIEQINQVLEDKPRYGNTESVKELSNKGNLGQLIEEHFFHYKCNSDSAPDFPDAGVELKVTPYKKTNSGKVVAKERLVLTMIDYNKVIKESFYTGHFWKKSRLLLLIYYLYDKDAEHRVDYRIDYAQLFTPPQEDLEIIKQDYEKIVAKIADGKAHELSEADTLYLSAAPKAANSSVRRSQPNSSIEAKPRAFAYKNSYMTSVLNEIILPHKNVVESILKDASKESFEGLVIEKILAYRGMSTEEIAKKFNVESNAKNLEAILAYRMLGIKGNKAAEFEKANVVVKTIRVEFDGRIKENMSFPTFKFKELVKETWENSTFGNYLRETRFFFVVYQYDTEGVLRLKGAQFWNIPYHDLEVDVKKTWERTIRVLKEGVRFVDTARGRANNLPKQSENLVCHVRPHAKNAMDTDELPNGDRMPKQCFWLNNSYILSQLNPELLK